MSLFPSLLRLVDESRFDRDRPGQDSRRGDRQAEHLVDGPTPYDVVYTENKVRLRHYQSDTDADRAVPVVFAYALINTPEILDLRSDQSVVGQFLAHGFDVFLIE